MPLRNFHVVSIDKSLPMAFAVRRRICAEGQVTNRRIGTVSLLRLPYKHQMKPARHDLPRYRNENKPRFNLSAILENDEVNHYFLIRSSSISWEIKLICHDILCISTRKVSGWYAHHIDRYHLSVETVRTCSTDFFAHRALAQRLRAFRIKLCKTQRQQACFYKRQMALACVKRWIGLFGFRIFLFLKGQRSKKETRLSQKLLHCDVGL